MELAFTALAKVAGGLGLSSAAGATSAGLGGASTVLSALQAVGTVFGGLSAASASRDAADQAELEAGQENVAATQRQTQMKRSLLNVLGENDVAFASAGIDISAGIAQKSREQASRRAVDEISIDRRDSDFRQALFRMRARGLRRRAGSEIGGALLGAASQMVGAGLDAGQRGGVTAGNVDPWADLRVRS